MHPQQVQSMTINQITEKEEEKKQEFSIFDPFPLIQHIPRKMMPLNESMQAPSYIMPYERAIEETTNQIDKNNVH